MRFKFLIPILISILLGYGFSGLMFRSYNRRVENVFGQAANAYFIKFDSFDTIEEKKEATSDLDHYIYILEQKKYHVFTGITKNTKNAEKIKGIQEVKGNKVSIVRRNVFNMEFITMLVQYDTLLSIANDDRNTLLITRKILQLYEEMESVNAI